MRVGRKRDRKRRRRRRGWRVLPIGRLGWLALCLSGPLVALNATVSSLGGDVGLFTLRYASERAQALLLLGGHLVRAQLAPSPQMPPIAALSHAARAHKVPRDLVLAVARAESSLVPTRISGTGAMGLMQLMPATARALGVSDPFDSQQNAQGGARYLRQLLDAYDGHLPRALAAYNAGPARVPPTRHVSLPAETRAYVARVLALR